MSRIAAFSLPTPSTRSLKCLAAKLVDATRHLARLGRSLRELSISPPMSEAALLHVIDEVIRRNRVRDGIVYMQVTRGAGPREFAFPGPEVSPTLVVLARAQRRGCADRAWRNRHRREDDARQPLGPLRYQNRYAAAGSFGEGRGPPCRGARSVVCRCLRRISRRAPRATPGL